MIAGGRLPVWANWTAATFVGAWVQRMVSACAGEECSGGVSVSECYRRLALACGCGGGVFVCGSTCVFLTEASLSGRVFEKASFWMWGCICLWWLLC